MKSTIISILLIAYFLISCEESTVSDSFVLPDEISEVSSYSLLKTGNYWVYQTYSCFDSTGTNCSPRSIDSVYISKDTIINGKKYYRIEGTSFGQYFKKYLRDSSDYLVDDKNEKTFSCSNGGLEYSSLVPANKRST